MGDKQEKRKKVVEKCIANLLDYIEKNPTKSLSRKEWTELFERKKRAG